jgi:SRSO17 transposase
MAKFTGTGAQQRLSGFMEMVGEVLGSDARRAAFAMYVHGLLSESARKSIEPIAARASGDMKHASAVHQHLHHFVANSTWDDRAVRLAVARYAIAAMEKRAPVDTWIIDDTGFLKQGKCSVGVQRQYTGSAGKIANCQVAVSLTVANGSTHLPIDFELFLPESWLEDPTRRLKAKIPADAVFKTKHDIALDMIERASLAGVPGRIILADSFYGHSQPFRDHLDLLGFDYAMGIYASDKMWRVDRRGNRRGELRSAREIAEAIGKKNFKRCTWREGTRTRLSSLFALVRVVIPRSDGIEPRTEWLLIEWPSDEKDPTRYALTTLPRNMSKKGIVRITKERYRTEQVYEEMKGELGLDHFEGRGFPGWCHHVTLTLCCYAFLVAERVRAFPPSARGTNRDDALEAAA